MKPCIHLDYELTRAPGLKQGEIGGIKFWIRNGVDHLERCQFCKIKRFRIRNYLDCYEPRYCGDYETE